MLVEIGQSARVYRSHLWQTQRLEGPVDESLREFLGEDAAIMAGLNPFINDLT
jgi:hypothetical protein